MDAFAINLIAALDGITQTHRDTGIPISTIATWKKTGIPASRLDHLKRVAKDRRIRINWKTGAKVARRSGVDRHVEASLPSHSPAEVIATTAPL